MKRKDKSLKREGKMQKMHLRETRQTLKGKSWKKTKRSRRRKSS